MRSLLLSAAVALLAAAPAPATSSQPLTLQATTPLPAIGAGDFDHFAVDLKRHELFVAAEANGTIETFDLTTGKHLQSARGVVMPHALALITDKNELFVADGGDSSVKVLDATSLRQVARIPVPVYPDGGAYDPASRLLYVGNQGKHGHLTYSFVTIVSVDKRAVVGRIRVPGDTLKALVLDPAASRLYVSVRDRSLVDVIDLKRRAVVASLSSPYMKSNTPLELAAGRIFVAGRKPNELVVMNAGNGTTVQHLPTVATADDLTVDTTHKRVYVTGSNGLDVYNETSGGRYAMAAHYDTLGGKTSVYVPSLERFYVPHSRTSAPQSGLQIYRVNP